jgi:hypothetical protein
MILRVKGWARFQHYKHRRPPWIRLHRSLLDDVDWHRLPVASRALAPMLWLLASETPEGSIDGASDTLAFRLRIASTELEEALNPLIAGGWIIKSDPDSVLLAPRKQDATSESEFRDQSTECLTSNLTEPARDAAPSRSRSAPRAKPPTVKERMQAIAAANHEKILGKLDA